MQKQQQHSCSELSEERTIALSHLNSEPQHCRICTALIIICYPFEHFTFGLKRKDGCGTKTDHWKNPQRENNISFVKIDVGREDNRNNIF